MSTRFSKTSYRPSEAAAALGWSLSTLKRYLAEGFVPKRTLPSGHRYLLACDLEQIDNEALEREGRDPDYEQREHNGVKP